MGRKTKDPKKQTVGILVRFDPDVYDILVAMAEEDDRSVNSLIRKIVNRHLKIVKKTS